MSKVIEVTDANFVDEVLNSDKPVLIDFYADWCGPCKQIAPTIEKFAEQNPDFKVVKVNVDQSPMAARDIRSIPTLAVVKDKVGGVIAQGVVPLSEIEKRARFALDKIDEQLKSNGNNTTGPKNGPKP